MNKGAAVKALVLLVIMLTPPFCSAKERDIIFFTGSAVTMNSELGTTDYHGDFGQYPVSGTGCCGLGSSTEYLRFRGVPKGEIVGRWKVFYLDPSKKEKPYAERIEKIRYFYARTRAKIKMPPPEANHNIWEVYLAFGPRTVFAEGLHAQDRPGAKHFTNAYGVEKFLVGDIDTLYYLIRSKPKNARTADWPRVYKYPFKFHAVKGIEISEKQYMTIACEMVGYDKCKKYLEKDAPGLTTEQLTYIRKSALQ